MTSISVIMSAYNEEVHIFKQSVESILNQKGYTPELILVIDNPSNTDLKQWVKENLSAKRNVCIVENKENLGLAKSLNLAIELAHGEYICRMDADDVALHNRLQLQLDYLKKHDVDLIGGRVIVIDENNKSLYETPKLPQDPNKIKKALRWNNCLAHPTWFGKREVFELGYRNIPLCEDYDFQLRAVMQGFKLGNSEDIVLKYRVSNSGLSQSNLFRQYLYQKYITGCYSSGQYASIDEANSYVQKSYSKNRAMKYDQAHKGFQRSLELLAKKRPFSAFLSVVPISFTSLDYIDKLRRLLLTSLI